MVMEPLNLRHIRKKNVVLSLCGFNEVSEQAKIIESVGNYGKRYGFMLADVPETISM